MRQVNELQVPALQVKQSTKRYLYLFAVDGKSISSFATVSRVKRTGASTLSGYQRPEVMSHISEIRNYLESKNPMVPNAIVIAFDKRVRFVPMGDQGTTTSTSQHGTLHIPIDSETPDESKPGWLVDGQQRVAAIREAKLPSFPISIVAFIAKDVNEQREQFILVNSTKPLPKGLIYELLPSTEGTLPSLLQRRRFPAHLVARLNHDEGSPLRGKIRTPTCSEGMIKDNSVMKMIENSLSDGVLYRFRGTRGGEVDTEAMLTVLTSFWSAASEVFEDAWGLPPNRSRLMHGAGVVGLGFVMDAIADRYRRDGLVTTEEFREDLLPLKDVCRWTDGYWDFGPGAQRKWNEVQNTTKDIQLLANYLLIQYKSRVWDRARRSPARVR